MTLRIALDASCTAKRERTGVARYAACLIEALAEAAPDHRFVLGCRLSRFRRRRHRFLPAAPNVRARWFVDRFARTCLGPFDVFHGLDARLPRGGRFPAVATVHDLGPLEDAAVAGERFRTKKLAAYRHLAERADRIVCVSAATRDAFRRLFPVPDERFAVVHHGLEPRFAPADAASERAVRERYRLRGPYLLFVGLVSARKNCARLVAAFERLAAARPDVQLALAGGSAHGGEEALDAIAASPHRARIATLGFVPDQDLPPLYSAAAAFVYPGLHEGFGLPLLEAFACGAPVVAADVPVSREVAGDAALLVDARSAAAIAAGLERVLGEPGLARALAERGRARAARFTWRSAAERTLEIYRELAGRNG